MEQLSEKADCEKAKKNALEILENFGVDCAPVNPAKIARELGITVNFANFPRHAKTTANVVTVLIVIIKYLFPTSQK